MCGTYSRRSSLKRQCKERISLFDYNPMFNLRLKRTKPTCSTKLKFPDHTDENKKNHENSDSSNYPFKKPENTRQEELTDNLSSLVNSIQSCHNLQEESPEEQLKVKNNLPEKEQTENGLNLLPSKKAKSDFIEQISNISEIKIKSKKQSKKKKKKLYKSLSMSGGGNFDQESAEYHSSYSSTELQTGPCEIKNGVIKIRLSKLPECRKSNAENDYEVSICDSALIGCKTLSVPLSPLSPAVYSAYCESFKVKKKGHSSSKIKHLFKKKSKKNGVLQGISVAAKINDSLNSISNEFEHEKNNKSNPEPVAINSEDNISSTVNSCENLKEENECKFQPTIEKLDVSCSSKLKESPISSHSRGYCTKIESEAYDDFPVSETSNAFSSNLSVQKTCSNSFETRNSQILCSINLSLLDRVPVRICASPKHDSNDLKLFSGNKKVDDNNLSDASNEKHSLNSSSTILNNNSDSVIKREIETPPICQPTNALFDKLESTNLPVPNTENSLNESCTNADPALSYEMTHPVEKEFSTINISENENDVHLSSKLMSAQNDLISVLRCDVPPKLHSSVLPHSQLNKVKIEFPDTMSSRHEKWNDFPEYNWCHDLNDIGFNAGLFKEQLSFNVTSHMHWQDPELKKQYSSEYYLNEAKKLKHQADKEIDRMVQAMKYLEAVLYFILTGNAMEHSYIDTDRVHTMYKETLALIRFISSKFQKLHNASCRNIDNKLTVLSLRCQSLLYLKLYQLRRDEVRFLHRSITAFLKSENVAFPVQSSPFHIQNFKQSIKHSQILPPEQASPCSLTPSPAGSVASVSSQSSGYSSSELGWSSTCNPGNLNSKTVFDDIVSVSNSKYKMLQQQSSYLANLHLCHDLWEHADYLSSKEHSREFFLELDEECGCLSLHSPFSALVHYVRKGLYKLKDGT
ncbi:AF4/FMR2 family member 4-like [Uloborus diversus]|uniref:AF4/FMR2 family member 4-like n=1 Tax=Uloborus diversus TaxID=327109 RepID=UPI002409097B|nr:AF4/FMR2 family member 4-like [Uloborus diversus]